MLLVAGGQDDHNIGRLLRRVLARKIPFVDILNGPALRPDVTYDMGSRILSVNGRPIRPSGVFIRHNVFLSRYKNAEEGQAEAINWFYFIRGWANSDPAVRCFNRGSAGGENNKVENLVAAQAAGLRVPDTRIQCRPPPPSRAKLIRKPVAGGELTRELNGRRANGASKSWRPFFYQPKLRRPELRVFVIGARLLACALSSDNVDYRNDKKVALKPAEVPKDVARGLLKLCRMLGLDFAAADLMLDRDGRYRFLEINTQPMFVAFDIVLDGAICDAIIDHLVS
jgi:hypothetical protein